MFGSFSRSYALVRTSWAALRQDKEILIFPILSGLASLGVAATFLIPVALSLVNAPSTPGSREHTSLESIHYLYLFAFYLVSYFVTIFFNVGVMKCAAIRMDGGDPTVTDGFKGAVAHAGGILAWALTAATVGVVLRVIEDRAAIVGKIASALLGLAWSLLTYFAVPVIIFENASVGQAIRRSGELFKRTWGEAVVGAGGMGLFFGLLSLLGLLPLGFAIVLASQGALAIPIAVGIGAVVVAYWISLAVVSAALQGVFHVALYRYAATGQVSAGYSEDLIAHHWRPKTAGGWPR
jgi:hypothetical protein